MGADPLGQGQEDRGYLGTGLRPVLQPALLSAVTRSTHGPLGCGEPEQKRQQGSGGIGWLRSPDGDQLIRIEGAGESFHAKGGSNKQLDPGMA